MTRGDDGGDGDDAPRESDGDLADEGDGTDDAATDSGAGDRFADRLDGALAGAFGGTDGERRAVTRAARDLRDAGRLRADRGRALDVDAVLAELREAPEGGPAERWNWWVGALDLAYGGYRQFRVRRYDDQ